MPLLTWFTSPDGLPRILADLKSGRAGLPLRVALSFAAAALALAGMFLILGLVDSTGQNNIREEHVIVGLACAFVAWFAALAWIWAGYPHWRRTIRTGFIVLSVWAGVTALCVIIAFATRRSEFLIASLIIAGLGTTIAIIAAAAYQSRASRPVLDPTGNVNVTCPTCNYSLIGLDSTTCPECGTRFTIDQLIKAQGYGEQSTSRSPAPTSESAIHSQHTLTPLVSD